MPAAKIIMFSDGVSESNRLAKDALEAQHLSWDERSTATDAETNAFVRKLCGAAVSPVLYVKDQWLPDPTQEELLEATGVRFDCSRAEQQLADFGVRPPGTPQTLLNRYAAHILEGAHG